MIFKVLTLFPEMFEGVLNSSILKRAIGKNLIEVKLINIRDYTKDKYNRTDTPPIGGGAGLIMKCQPIIDALKDNITPSTHKILLSPRGKQYNQLKAKELAQNYDDILILCGHYEGIDERVYPYFDEIISIGDYILTGGFFIIQFSFSFKILSILYSGNHNAISKWRKKESLRLTKKYREDLFSTLRFSKEEEKLLKELESGETPKWENEAILKGHKFIKNK